MPKKKNKNKDLNDSPSLTIELEENAEQIFADAIEGNWRPSEHSSFEDDRPKKSKKGKSSRVNRRIDLHGMTVVEAQNTISNLMSDFRSQYTGIVHLKVITGKGLHSSTGVGVLGREIHDYISNKYVNNIMEIDDSPCDVLMHGVPIRGHFNVVFKF